MAALSVERVGAVLAGVWGGLLGAIALIGAPAGFAVAARDVAGRVAGRMFAQEAYLSLVVAVVLFFIVRRRAVEAARDGGGSVVGADVPLVLLTLFCTIAGYFALLPVMDVARTGRGPLSFGALHALSAGFYAVKTLAVLALAWRLSGDSVRTAPLPVRPDAARQVSRSPIS